MNFRPILCLLLVIMLFGCVSRKLALRQPNDAPATNIVLNNATHAVALIISTSANFTPLKYSEASNGIIISADGYILTVSHGLSYKMPVVYIDDERYGGEIVYNNIKYDFAILKIAALHPLPFLRFARETSLKQNVCLLGKFRKNREVFVSKGTLNVKGINMKSKEVNLFSTNIGQKRKVDYAIQNGIIHSARLFEGLSGCPLLDENGDVIGMNSEIIGSEERRITPAPEMIGFLPVMRQYSDMQIPGTNVDTSDFAVDLEDPVKRLDWIMKGLSQYGSFLGKNTARIEELRDTIEKQATEKIKGQKSRDKEAIQWAWKTFLTEVYTIK
jgi:hypothetical protein